MIVVSVEKRTVYNHLRYNPICHCIRTYSLNFIIIIFFNFFFRYYFYFFIPGAGSFLLCLFWIVNYVFHTVKVIHHSICSYKATHIPCFIYRYFGWWGSEWFWRVYALEMTVQKNVKVCVCVCMHTNNCLFHYRWCKIINFIECCCSKGPLSFPVYIQCGVMWWWLLRSRGKIEKSDGCKGNTKHKKEWKKIFYFMMIKIKRSTTTATTTTPGYCKLFYSTGRQWYPPVEHFNLISLNTKFFPLIWKNSFSNNRKFYCFFFKCDSGRLMERVDCLVPPQVFNWVPFTFKQNHHHFYSNAIKCLPSMKNNFYRFAKYFYCWHFVKCPFMTFLQKPFARVWKLLITVMFWNFSLLWRYFSVFFLFFNFFFFHVKSLKQIVMGKIKLSQ